MINIAQEITSWMEDLSHNALEPGSELKAFDSPIVGIARGDDPLFGFLKQDIGAAFYWTPEEAFLKAYPEEMVQAEELSVIAWILPQTENTLKAHRKELETPSIEWSMARHYGEKVNESLRLFVVNLYSAEDCQACAPVLQPQWQKAHSARYGFASSWSERHTAHVCGLGTFGASDGLITPVGKAVRVGSAIVRRKLSPTLRTYGHHNSWCLYHARGKCLACAGRCPAGAISKHGHDKNKCKQYIRNVTADHVEQQQLGFKVNSCGLCQTKVPCENSNPLSKQK